MGITALQEAFSLLEELHPSLFDIHTEKGRTFVNTFHEFLELEKEQIEEAYNVGYHNSSICSIMNCEEYYEETFKP